jgi:protein-tyrosine phosphatase
MGPRVHADDPKENILCVLHECFDYIDEARTNGGKVYVHCSQGVSRSATIAIGYCIWKLNKDFDLIFEYVKKIRTVVSPNMGFQYVALLSCNALVDVASAVGVSLVP